ncbi:MAG: hypothetical protein ACTHMY_20135 [Solirubrobacteraceae bacterium]
MNLTRAAAAVLLCLRVSYGAALIAAPGRLALRWLGESATYAPVQVPVRALGTREVLLHTGALIALRKGATLRPWLAASIAGDLTDVIATAAGRRRLPAGSPLATLAVGGGSALVSLVLARAVDE